MKHIVLTDSLSSAEIRPPGAFRELREQSISDAKLYLSDPSDLEDVGCPACESSAADPAFDKHGFTYRECERCGSVYVSPRPSARALKRYYSESEASRLRTKYFIRESGLARAAHVVQSRVDWIAAILESVTSSGRHFADFGTLYLDLSSELRRLGVCEILHTVEPPLGVVEALASEDVVVGKPAPGTALAATAFEQLEHQSSPKRLLREVHGLLAPGGMFFVTTRTISGFDLQVLWGATPYIYVPEHLNLLSIEGLSGLFEAEGFDLIELSTPGQLDVELVSEASESDEAVELPSFVEYMLAHRSTDTHSDLQSFLQRNRLSSHVRIAAQKR